MRSSTFLFFFTVILACTYSCDKKRAPILEETVAFQQDSAYLPFDLYKDGQRVSVYAKVNIQWVTTSEYKLQVFLTLPDGEVMSEVIERVPEGEVNPMESGKGGMVELKREQASDEYRLFSFITKNGSYDIEFLRDQGYTGAELKDVKISIVPQ